MAILSSENPDYQDIPFNRPPSIEELLDRARRRIQVTDEELNEARRRRDLLSAALLDEFRGSRAYVNGSVAHGDALDPLTDIDLGVVVAEAKDTHGPGKKGCSDLQERAALAIRRGLSAEFPNLRVEWRSRRRSILVRFGKAVSFGQDDFTADVIIAVDNPDGEGLYIPNYLTWSRSHPEEHTRMVREANKNSNYSYARIVRLTKHYNRRNQKPLCSWNIKALGLDSLTRQTSLARGLVAWFDHAIDSLAQGLTEDPAGVAEKPISINEKMTRTEVVDRLKASRERLTNALQLERDGYLLLAHEELAKFFKDEEVLPYPNVDEVRLEAVRKYNDDRRKAAGANAAARTAPVVGLHPGQHAANTRSWGS